jgi:hypothetical protein
MTTQIRQGQDGMWRIEETEGKNLVSARGPFVIREEAEDIVNGVKPGEVAKLAFDDDEPEWMVLSDPDDD